MAADQPKTMYKIWAVFLYIFAILDALVMALVVFIWIYGASKLGQLSSMINVYSFGYLRGSSAIMRYHVVMGCLTLAVLVEVLINTHCGVLLMRKEKKGKGIYIFYGVLNVLGALGEIAMCILLIIAKEPLYILIYMFPLIACIITAIMLFLRGWSDESGIAGIPPQPVNPAGIPPQPVNPAGIPPQPVNPAGIPPQPVKPAGISPQPLSGGLGAAGIGKTVPFEENIFQDPPVKTDKVTEKLEPESANGKAMGRVMMSEGTATSPGFRLPENRKIIIGKSPQKCNLIVTGDPYVSNIHCSVRYVSSENSYIVTDHSTNGTFVQGARLPKDKQVKYPAGVVLTLASGKSKVSLG